MGQQTGQQAPFTRRVMPSNRHARGSIRGSTELVFFAQLRSPLTTRATRTRDPKQCGIPDRVPAVPDTTKMLRRCSVPSCSEGSPVALTTLASMSARRIGLLVGLAAAALALAPLTTAAVHEHALANLKLPAERTSPTGNFFTLEAYAAPTSSHAVANFEMKVCTSAHTPAGTAIVPALFTLSLTRGGSVAESTTAAKKPALVLKPLKPLQCVEGWLGFNVPKGKTVSKLEYDYNGTISWNVG